MQKFLDQELNLYHGTDQSHSSDIRSLTTEPPGKSSFFPARNNFQIVSNGPGGAVSSNENM